ncbi:MAG: FecR domain-containing protein [Magnetococcales bacterium]|nr:FecR domain-containing protein [Magnetococcales bacterium]
MLQQRDNISANPFEMHTYVLDATGVDSLILPQGNMLLRADFHSQGDDLILRGSGEHAGQSIRIQSYFSQETQPELQTLAGARITKSLVSHLAQPEHPVMVAEASTNSVNDLSAIGSLETVNGDVVIIRGGLKLAAKQGMALHEGDVIETADNGSVGLVYADDSTVSLGSSGRMVIEEMTYDPGAGVGKSTTEVVQGTFSFVSGEVAKLGHDAMIFKTPVASIGIRGTTVAGQAGAEGSENTFTLLADADGGVGEISVSNDAGTQILSQANQTTSVTSYTAPPAIPFVMSAAQVAQRYGTTIQIRPTAPGQNRSDNNEASQDGDGESDAGDEGEAEVKSKGEGEGEAPPEGEGEGEAPPEGEGESEAEGEAPPEGEGEGEVSPEGEGEGKAEDEGEGEGEGRAEGDAPLEGDGERVEEGEAPPGGEGERLDGDAPAEDGEGTPFGDEPPEDGPAEESFLDGGDGESNPQEDGVLEDVIKASADEVAGAAELLDEPIGDGPLDDIPLGDAPLGEIPIGDGPLDESTLNDALASDSPLNDGSTDVQFNDDQLNNGSFTDNDINQIVGDQLSGDITNSNTDPISTTNYTYTNDDPPISIVYSDETDIYEQNVNSDDDQNVIINTEYNESINLTPVGYEDDEQDIVIVEQTVTEVTATTITEPAPTPEADDTNVNAPRIIHISPPHDGFYVAGDTLEVTLSFDRDITLSGSSSYISFVLGANIVNATYSSHTSSSITYSYTVVTGDLDVDGLVVDSFNLNGDTITGSTGVDANMHYDGHHEGAFVVVDAVKPVISSVSIDNSTMYVGDVVTATITVGNDRDYLSLSSGTIGGFSLYSLNKINPNTYEASFAIADGGTNYTAASDIPVSLVLQDSAGNTSDTYSTAISQDSDTIYANYPSISLSYGDSSGNYKTATESDASTVILTATADVAYGQDITVDVLMGGTASEGIDYGAVSDITISAGSLTGHTNFAVINDGIEDDGETITASINGLTYGSDGGSTQSLTIGILNTVTSASQALTFTSGQDIVSMTGVYSGLDFTPTGTNFDVTTDIIRFSTANTAFGSGWVKKTNALPTRYLTYTKASTPNNSRTKIRISHTTANNTGFFKVHTTGGYVAINTVSANGISGNLSLLTVEFV